MDLTFNSYAIPLLVSGLFTLLLALLLLNRFGKASKWFGINMIFTAWWAITYGFELASTTLKDILFWINLEYIGITILPITWLISIALFTGKEKLLTKRNLLIISVIPVITLLLVWTSNYNQLYYQYAEVDYSAAFPMLNFKPGTWYHIFTIYFYINIAVGCYLLLSTFKRHDRIYRKQKNIILIAVIIPLAFNFFYVLGFKPLNHLDLTPYAFLTTSLLIGIGLLRFRLFDIVPIAREKILEAMRDGVMVIDSHGRVIDINAMMKTILSVTGSKKIIGKKFNTILPQHKVLNDLLANHQAGKIELQHPVKKEERCFEVDINQLNEADELYSGSIILFRDITERKKAEEKLNEQSNELINLNGLKDRLFSIIGHDLRAPMMNLKLLMNMIDTGMITTEEFKSFLPELSKKLTYTSSLLENLLHWSKSQLAGQGTNPVTFDLKKICESEIDYFKQKALEKGITINDTIAHGTFAYADVDMIELVIRNIVGNALKFSSSGDVITISSQRSKDDMFVICIEDTGRGMKSEQVEKLFTADVFTTRGTNNEQGTGIGLQLCKEFIEKNGGEVWAKSEDQGGTSVFFTLPVQPFEEAVPELEVA